MEHISSYGGEYHCILELMKLFCGGKCKKYFALAYLIVLGFS